MGEFMPEYEFVDSQTFKVDYSSLGTGGWGFDGSPFFPSDDLYRNGSVSKEGPIEIRANVYYCYRTKDKNGKWVEIPKMVTLLDL